MEPEIQNSFPDDGHKHVHTHSLKRQLLISFSIFLFLAVGTTLAIFYGKGYRLFLKKGEPAVSKTGTIHATSIPSGAQIYVNGHATAVTETSISLVPNKYSIKIAKDGYQDWQKDYDVEKEIVEEADATLYPKSPTLQSISTLGIASVVVDPSGTKLAFKIASDSAKKNGIYIFDMTARSFPVLAGQSGSTQIADDSTDFFSQAKMQWSPDGKQLLATITNKANKQTYYLLKTDSLNETPQDVTAILSAVQDTWKTQRDEKIVARNKILKPAVHKFANKYFRILAWSPDENKILYQASESAQMPVFLKPRRIGNNHLYEQRSLDKNAIYVYDIKEDINTRIVEDIDELCTDTMTDCTSPFRWFPDSYHLIYVTHNSIKIVEDDGANMTTIYAGPFMDNYVFPWPDGTKIVILTNLNNQGVPPTLYSIGLK